MIFCKKKNILFMLCVLFTSLMAFISIPQSSFAYNGGLLEGKELNRGQTAFRKDAVTDISSTDNNLKTAGRLSNGGFYPTAWYLFPDDVTVKSFYVNSDSTNLQMLFYDSEGTLLSTEYINSTEVNTSITPLTGVRRVALYNPAPYSSNYVHVYEWDIYGSAKAEQPQPLTLFSGEAGDSSATLTWESVSDADSYTIKYGTESGNYTETIPVSVTSDTYQNYTVPGLTNGTTYYFVVSATVNGLESENSNEVSVTPLAAPKAVLDISINEDTATVGDKFIANVSLKNIDKIYAEDFTIQYDPSLFEYLGFDEVEGYKVYNTPTDENGRIRFIVASQGEEYGISEAKTFLNLNFKAKAVGTGDVDALYCRVANTTTEWDLEGDSCGSDTVTIEQADIQDVDRSGEYTLVDLAIDGYYFGRSVADTDTTNHSADQMLDDNVNDDDLVYIVNQMLSNTNYKPNLL